MHVVAFIAAPRVSCRILDNLARRHSPDRAPATTQTLFTSP